MLDPALSLVLALALALLFATAVAHKLRDWPYFRASLENYRVLPAALVAPAGALAAAVEFAAAVTLPFPGTRAFGALAGAALLSAYAVAIAVNLRRGRTRIDCGCFGAARRERIAPWMVLRNAVLALASLAAALPVTSRPLGALDALTIAGGLAAAAVLYLAFGTLGSNAGRLGESA
jgi:hypothetical protein